MYGNAAGAEVLVHLHEHPTSAVPIVLNRLRAKDEEWKKSLRDWNRVWREADAQNYDRALDHQAVLAASADRSLLAAKPLVAEIEALRLVDRMRGRSKPQLDLAFSSDDTVLIDALKLTLSYLDRAKQYSDKTKDRIESNLRAFVISYFGLSHESIEEALAMPEPSLDAELDDSDSSTIPLSHDGLRPRRNGDLRKKALRNASLLIDAPERPVPATAAGLEGMEGVETVVAGVDAVTAHPDGMDVEMEAVKAVHAEPDEMDSTGKSRTKAARDQDIFCHSQHYVLLRLLHLLQTRLSKIKDHSSYPRFLELAEHLFSEQITLESYQESISKLLGSAASSVYTLSKVLHALIRATAACVEATTYGRNQRIFQLLEEARTYEGEESTMIRTSYRRAIEASLGPEENVYHVVWSSAKRTATVQLLTRVDPTPQVKSDEDERWLSYIALYSSDKSSVEVKNPFLSRALGGAVNLKRRDGLRMRIDRRTYKLGYIAGTEDALIRIDAHMPGHGSDARLTRFMQWLSLAIKKAEEAARVKTPPPQEVEVMPIEPTGDTQLTATAAAAEEEEETKAAASAMQVDEKPQEEPVAAVKEEKMTVEPTETQVESTSATTTN